MNGKVFPSEFDHALPMSSRAQEMCGRAEERVNLPTMYSSQNAALLQFRVPNRGGGFAFRVSFVHNPERESASPYPIPCLNSNELVVHYPQRATS